MKYRVLIEQDEDGVFVAEVPALPGCISQGQTRSEVLKNIQEAIEVYLEGDADFGNTTCTDVDSTGDQGTNWEVLEGQTERFTVTILGDGGEAGGAGSSVTFKARIAGIGYNVTTDATGDTVYNFSLTDYKSKAVTVFDR